MKFEGWNEYEIIKDGMVRYIVDAPTHEMAYRKEANWWFPETPITIRDKTTGECQTFTRKLDNAGNLVSVIRH